ncbi:MAG TPA: HNH endonuclease [Verrucomicrobiae bacterium]|nr:HNH endonuclease [Verrucomicrobiae bacterium]
MKLSENQKKTLDHYDQHYIVVFDSSLKEERPVKLADHDDVAGRTCRFCGKGKPNVTFKNVAHAVPEFLGNKSLISMNECDTCNQTLAQKYEDDLAKWFGPMRTVSQIKGKNGVPTLKSKDMQIRMGNTGLEIGVVTEDLESHLKFDGPFTFTLPVPAKTQPFIPINAAKALVKIACSLCPPALLGECQHAIDWLMDRAVGRMSKFPVLFSFTPGPMPYGDGRILLLKRSSSDKFPFLWCIVATANYRFQFFVPFCPSDAWMMEEKTVQFTLNHFPDVFGDGWPHGKTTFEVMDWSGTEPVIKEFPFSFHVESVVENKLPPTA